jgi:hypothetical protein
MKKTLQISALSLALLSSAAFGACHNGSCAVKYDKPMKKANNGEMPKKGRTERVAQGTAHIVEAPFQAAGTVIEGVGQGVGQVVEAPARAAGTVVEGAAQGAGDLVTGVGEGVVDVTEGVLGIDQ